MGNAPPERRRRFRPERGLLDVEVVEDAVCAGNDEIQGEGGDDVIIGGRDNGAINGNSLVIGDNLYGNDGRDTFVFQKGDGVDLIWDFQAGIDSLVIKGYDFDAGALRFVNQVTNDGRDGAHPLNAHGHQKLALVMDADGDAIVFNDPGNRADSAGSVRFGASCV